MGGYGGASGKTKALSRLPNITSKAESMWHVYRRNLLKTEPIYQ